MINKRRITAAVAVVALLLAAVFFVKPHMNGGNTDYNAIGNVRNAPYPYKSMLAICSDIDGTTPGEFELIHSFLNGTDETPLGTGLGLDIADSFWMYTANDDGVVHDFSGAKNDGVMTYFNGTSGVIKDGDAIAQYFDAGQIDTMHGYGDFSRVDRNDVVFSRELAATAAAEMQSRGLLPYIWVNHGNSANTQNFGNTAFSLTSFRRKYQQGANADSPYYHADFTVPNGIRYVWFSNSSNKFAQESPLYPVTLADGQRIWGFNRYTGETSAFMRHSYNWDPYLVNEQLSAKHMKDLVDSGGVAVVAQHLGGTADQYVLPTTAVETFKELKQYEARKEVLVARASRLLEFVRARDYLKYDYKIGEKGAETIILSAINDPVLGSTPIISNNPPPGLSFNVVDAMRAKIVTVDGAPVDEGLIERFELVGGTGVIGIKWE